MKRFDKRSLPAAVNRGIVPVRARADLFLDDLAHGCLTDLLQPSLFGHDRDARIGGRALPEVGGKTNGESDDHQRWIRVAHREEH
jgi:hypothetical protein